MIAAVVALEKLAVVDSVAERNTVDLVVLLLSSLQLPDFLLNFRNTLHKLEVDSLAPERAVNREFFNLVSNCYQFL